MREKNRDLKGLILNAAGVNSFNTKSKVKTFKPQHRIDIDQFFLNIPADFP